MGELVAAAKKVSVEKSKGGKGRGLKLAKIVGGEMGNGAILDPVKSTGEIQRKRIKNGGGGKERESEKAGESPGDAVAQGSFLGRPAG